MFHTASYTGRRILTVCLATTAVVAAAMVVPVVTPPSAAAAPVEPEIQQLALDEVASSAPQDGLSGVDDVPQVLTTQREVAPFTLLGVTWSGGARGDLVVHARVREDGRWSGWERLDPEDGAPQPGTVEAVDPDRRWGTSPLLTAGADGVQVRVDWEGLRPKDLRTDLIDAGASRADAVLDATQVPAATADAATPAPAVISRAQWGADESLRTGSPAYSPSIKVGIVHHTASTNTYTPEQAAAQVRSIYAYHTRGQGWSDIGYNFLVDKFGRVYEGRYGGIDRAVVGAHSGGFNSNTFGVAALGNYQEATAPPAMKESISRVLAWKLSLNYVDPRGSAVLTSAGGGTARYPAGTSVTVPTVIGHSAVGQTVCPGQNLTSQLGEFRDRALQLMGAGLSSPQAVTEGASVRVTAGMLSPGSWSVRVLAPDGTTVRTATGSGSSVGWRWDGRTQTGAWATQKSFRYSVDSVQNGVAARQWTSASLASSRSLVGQVDSRTTGLRSVRVRGWALDPGQTAPVTVTVRAGATRLSTGPASLPRGDVGAAYPSSGPDHGFDVTAAAPPGVQDVCVEATLGERSGEIGCTRALVPGDEPLGSLDAVSTRTGWVDLRGWALDGNTTAALAVHVYVDGKGAGVLRADAARGDIGALAPAWGSRRGFAGSVPVFGGARQVCAYAINVGPGSGNPLLGCRAVTAPGTPTGALDLATPSGGGLLVEGWALDPDTATAAGVHVYVDGRYARSATADRSRPDVGARFPATGSARGYRVSVPAAPGARRVCVYALNGTGAAAPNTTLGCRTVTVRTGSPFGAFDSATRSGGSIRVRGWEIDPDSAATGVLHVHVDGRPVAAFTTGTSRPDVARVHPGFGTQRGFDLVVPAAAGRRTVCVYGIDQPGTAPYTQLGCRVVG